MTEEQLEEYNQARKEQTKKQEAESSKRTEIRERSEHLKGYLARKPRKKTSIIIELKGVISFQIVIPSHDITSREYIARVNSFRQAIAIADSLLDDLGIANPETRLATGDHTPGTGAIYLKIELGRGGFSVVIHFWNVSDRSEFAVKEPSEGVIQRRDVSHGAWQRARLGVREGALN
ncbi:hypothetical protein F4778DRAFT_714914 [Xylariomycetidae sp. FL2044]|nr:hypothetical protein F4778DRAFT_714914 [Xylariomycetidae sp. FL2044]